MGSEGGQQFCLRWHNYQRSLLATLPQLLDGEDLTDVTLCAAGRSIKAHRIVLSACSQYFKDIFREVGGGQHPVIVVPGAEFSELCALVTFMYSGEVNIYQHQLPGLLNMADTLHIRGLAEFTADSERKEVVEEKRCNKRAKLSPERGVGGGVAAGTNGGAQGSLEPLVNPYRTMYPRKPNKCGGGRGYRGGVGVGGGSLVGAGEEEAEDLSKRGHEGGGHPLAAPPTPTTPATTPTTPVPGGGDPLTPTTPDTPPAGLLASPHPELTQVAGETVGRGSGGGGQSKLYATCFVCGKQLSNQYNLRVHMETHQNAHYACASCNHVSRSRDALRKHVSYRHPPPQQQQQVGGGGGAGGVVEVINKSNT